VVEPAAAGQVDATTPNGDAERDVESSPLASTPL